MQLCSSITAVDFEGTKIFRIRLLLHAVKNAAKRYIRNAGQIFNIKPYSEDLINSEYDSPTYD